ncbi:MAG TPA: hypothetical protein VHR65_08000 [Solirubrobacterales bacterium]|nr:hypothetical protein [Solirubrobacterales bacterium]
MIESPTSDNEAGDEHRAGKAQQSPGEADSGGLTREPQERLPPSRRVRRHERGRGCRREEDERDCVPPV